MKKLFTSSSALWSFLFALAMMFVSQSAMAEYVKLTALSGSRNLNDNEGCAKLVDTYDGKNGRSATKWGQGTNFGEGGEAWVIVKADKVFSPTDYFLVTANDTNSNQGRQWTGWNIYGANFESDAAASKDAEAWVLIDQREGADLSMQNLGVTQFKLDTDPENLVNGSLVAYDGTPYQYFMIEVTAMKTDGQYLQMGEFGFGTHADFETWLEIQAADPTKPLTYKIIEGTRNNGDNEGLPKLFDGTSSTKWGNGFANKTSDDDTTNGAYFVIKASRPICPTYYCLTTANDTGNSPGRNWKKWRIFGMNGSSDPARTSDGWVLIDSKENIGRDQLAAANYTDCYFTLSEGSTTAYKYFRVEIDECVDASTYMQMAEFALGDAYTLAIARNTIIESFGFNPDAFAEKALLDQMAEFIESIGACEDPKELGTLNAQGNELKNKIVASANKYAELTTARNMALNQLADNNVANAAISYVNGWINETDAIAPGDDYPAGNFAYIKANRQLTGEEASAEAKRFTAYLQSNVKVVDDPIGDVGYTFLSGTTENWNAKEGPESLIDGDRDGTKWGTGTSGDRFLIFKADEPIKPTYYGLVTGGDTHTYTDRNWHDWKIWAANFDSDEDATKNADGWVLIDEKYNVGEDVLKTTNLFESYINLSIGCAVPYEYFKIEVYHNGGMQMNEFTFYNQGDFVAYRESFVADFEWYDPRENPAYIGYIEDYEAKYQELQNATNAPDLMKLKNELTDLQNQISSSVDKYNQYEEMVSTLIVTGPASESLQDWFNGYTDDNIAPNNMYKNGTYAYIMKNWNLDDEAMGQAGEMIVTVEEKDGKTTVNRTEVLPSGEIGYIQNMIKAAEAEDGSLYILLDGHTDAQWGDGFYGHLIDGIPTEYEDEYGKVKGTKWGGNAGGLDNTFENTYIIFRTPDPTNPFFYTLTTGNDTKVNTGRNWGTWYIYGGNFEGDAAATKDADGWDLIDKKENIGQERLHPENEQPSYFGFSTETTVPYTYYKVVVTKAYSGNAIQMNELHFGTPEEFEEIKTEYTDAAYGYEYDIMAEQALIDKYVAVIPEIDECANMEALFRVNYQLETLRDSIATSHKAYVRYEEAVEEVKAYLKANNLDESDAKTTLENYLTTSVEPSEELYPNGSAVYIFEEHLLADSVVLAEIEFMESLKVAAVNAGYVAGCDISSLIVNRTFAKAGETLKDEAGNNIGREAEGWNGYIFRTANANGGDIYAAEFCNYLAKFDVNQTLTGMKNGYYKVTLNAGYRANGDLLSYNYAPLAYANDVKTFIPVLREDAIEDEAETWKGNAADKPIYACDVQDRTEDPAIDSVAVAWCIWGCEGAAHAFDQGRYAITMVAQVTDGTLTIGVKNSGTKGNEWTGVGNFGLVYLGETAGNAALKEAADYNAARITTLLDVYESDVEAVNPETNEYTYPNAPGFAAAQKTILAENKDVATLEAAKIIGETMEAICATKKAYANLFEVSDMVHDKWINFISPDSYDMETEVDAIKVNMQDGEYEDAAAADAAAAELMANYPDYMEVVESNQNVGVDISDEEAFNYMAYSYGASPAVKIGGNFYDALTEDEVIFAFEYSATEELPLSRFFIGKDADDTQAMDLAIPAAAELTQVYIDLSKAVKDWGFGKVNDEIRWRFTTASSEVEVGIRHARMITKAQMKAEGGKPLNQEYETGDVNGDSAIDIADVVKVLSFMAEDATADEHPEADVNGDRAIDIADVVKVLSIMAEQ